MTMSRKRPLTPEEKKLWEQVTRDDKPISSKKKDDGLRMTDDARKKIVVKKSSVVLSPSPSVIRHPSSDLKPGNYANIDRRTSDRFRKGEKPIDGTLDLHGMSREKAYVALHGFLKKHYAAGSRCLLVITGKGKAGEGGVLRQAFPAWLSEPEFAPMILAFDTAKQKHGGSGAFYILLKRKR